MVTVTNGSSQVLWSQPAMSFSKKYRGDESDLVDIIPGWVS
jgi:hypothetical protein